MSERDEFEAWAKFDGFDISRHRIYVERYANPETSGAWDAWMARAARAPQAVPALTMDAGEVEFLANRLRRLFNHFEYPLPNWASDDKHLIGIAPTCIGAVLANLNAAPKEPR